MKVALIIGSQGQDGTYLSSLLLTKGYIVHGVTRTPKPTLEQKNLYINKINILDVNDLENLIIKIKPCEIYYLATTHEHSLNRKNYDEVMNVNVTGVINTLEIIKNNKFKTRFFYASSSNIFSGSSETPQTENTKFNPKTLYGIAKNTAMQFIDIYRETYKVFACYGILYNHESPLRNKMFVTMKIVDAVVNIKLGYQKKLKLKNIYSLRDWGSAEDYVEAMWLMLQEPNPDNYIIGTGKTSSVKDVLDYAFGYFGFNWKEYVEIEEDNKIKPAIILVADNRKIKQNLGWSYTQNIKDIILHMIKVDLERKQTGLSKSILRVAK